MCWISRERLALVNFPMEFWVRGVSRILRQITSNWPLHLASVLSTHMIESASPGFLQNLERPNGERG